MPGPGAGFAVLSSFWTILSPSLFLLRTGDLADSTTPANVSARKAYGKAQVKRVVIVGFDGMDPELASRFMGEGKLPNLAKLRDSGTFRPLRTTCPAISPVAWSTFQTGVNPGKHNIYDFLARDLKNYLPYLSSAQISEPTASEDWQVFVATRQIGSQGTAQGNAFLALAGQGRGFLLGHSRSGNFSAREVSRRAALRHVRARSKGEPGNILLLHNAGEQEKFREGGVRIPIEKNGYGFHSYIPGPENPLGTGGDLRADFKTVQMSAAARRD